MDDGRKRVVACEDQRRLAADKFMKEVGKTLQSGNAALFLLIRKMTTGKELADLQGVGGTVLRTSFDETKEAALAAALAGVQAAHAAAASA